MSLIKDLIAIPERVHQGDFVLQLSKGVTEPEQTLRDYVVTPQLVDAFGNAMGFIQQAVQTGNSKAAYLHGSFGSGKSHFMAVLNLLLAGNMQARATPELADVVARHSWTEGRKFLLVPYHMIGARDMESAILGQYADHVRRLHPDAALPGFYHAEQLFQDANERRALTGDATFFDGLNAGSAPAENGWGALDSGWTAERYEAALREPPHGAERTQLVGDLIRTYFKAYTSIATGQESYISLDDGLSVMSRHAQSLGYDAVILFLDELVLWLASHAADPAFVAREGTKLVKLVEATNANRPIPIVSFVARQRDLRELVGENLAGAVQSQFSDVLKHWEARFHKVTLEDRNLPAIAQRRVLRPVNEAARQTLDNAFQQLFTARQDVIKTLLTTTADQQMFRQVYPFSPALVQTLIAVSATLQRERTALRLMLQLLVDRREDLSLGQLIPVGDLFDAIAEGDEPFSEGMRQHFDNAKRLYRQRLLPMLETQHGVSWEAVKQGDTSMAAKSLRNDARLLKTLLLAALVPEVEALKALNAGRLAALNHGSVQSPIPGREASLVLARLRDWAAQVGEIKIGDGNDPIISLQVTGVDLEPILAAASNTDNTGNRRRKIREALLRQLNLDETGQAFLNYEFTWRNTRREVELVYENAREATDERLKGRGSPWTVLLDYPFDEPNMGPMDDIARLSQYRGGDTRTVVWLPSFLSPKSLDELGRLVVLDHILQGDRFDQYASTLSLVDRTQAKELAKNSRDQLQHKLNGQLMRAYGLSTEPQDAIVSALTPDQQLRSLDSTLSPRMPVGADFKSAFESLLDQLFNHLYPRHPAFETEIKVQTIRRVWEEVAKAVDAPQNRNHVQDSGIRKILRGLVAPLRLGQMGETHLVVDNHWVTVFNQAHARDGGGPITVAKLRAWIDQPTPMGLPVEVQNLVILTYAALTQRKLVLRGGPVAPDVASLHDELELQEQVLPSATDWQSARQRAADLFGLTIPEMLNAANVGKLVQGVKDAAKGKQKAAEEQVTALTRWVAAYATNTSSRLTTAICAKELTTDLAQRADAELVGALASARLDTSAAAIATSLSQAATNTAALNNANSWQLLNAAISLSDEARRSAAQGLRQRLHDLFEAEEHVSALAPALVPCVNNATTLLASAPSPPPPAPPSVTPVNPPVTPPVVPPAPPVIVDPDEVVLENQQNLRLDGTVASQRLAQLGQRLQDDPDLELTVSWKLVRRGKPR
jgi:hypothetical protein